MKIRLACFAAALLLVPGAAAPRDLIVPLSPYQTRQLARGVTLDGKARVFPGMIMDGNIGTQLLNEWDITLDLKNGRAWLNPSRKGGRDERARTPR